MVVISHRGYWRDPAEKNQEAAFVRSFALGFGTETDVRDHNGELVISHDMPDGSAMPLQRLLALHGQSRLPLAMNIKADGLAMALGRAMRTVPDWFVFDMSIPDTRAWLQAGVPVLMRMSEVERTPPWLEQAAGVWLDAFDAIWYDTRLIGDLLAAGKRVCIVSPELHGREHRSLWQMLLPLSHQPQLMLCTDLPEQAQAFFGTHI